MGKEAKILLGIGLATVAIIIGGAVLFSRVPTEPENEIVTEATKPLLVKDDSHQTKKENAKITIVEFADLQCPACGAAHPIVKAMKEEYKDSVNFVFRHFPLDSHKNAFAAALASEAAAKQGKFWEMQDKLFDTQEDWSDEANPTNKFVDYAKELGLNEEEFKKSLESREFEAKIRSDYMDGVSLGVSSTPTTFINGVKRPGVILAEEFKTLVDKELEGK